MFLKPIVEDYILERDNCQAYNEHLRRAIRYLGDYFGEDAAVHHLTYEKVNAWLDRQLKIRSKHSVQNYRRMILTIWNHCAEKNLCEWPASKRVKRIRTPRSRPQAFTPDEIRSLLEASRTLIGDYDDGIARADYWHALIYGAYDLGFRRGDMFSLPRGIVDGRPFCWVESKSGMLQCRQLSQEGSESLSRIEHKSLAYPWMRSLSSFRKSFETIKRRAGVRYGCFKWLRRTHGTYAGTLGHRSPEVFERHYNDTGQVMSPTGPGPLRLK